SYLCEEYTKNRAVAILNFLGVGHVNMALRFVMRDAAAILLLARTEAFPTSSLLWIVTGYSAIHALRFGVSMATEYTANRRKPIYLTRNVDLSALAIPDAPARILTSGGRRRLVHLAVLANFGAVGDALLGTGYLAAIGTATGALLGIALLVPMLVNVRRVRHLHDRDRYKQAVLAQLEQYAPEVVLYFSHEPKVKDSAYQVNMWLSTLERLGRRFMVLVREPQHVERIAPTDAPIVCIPGGADVVNFELPSLRVALYPGNTGKNIHLLRSNAIKHVFIGHGDSDKASSANPFCTVYDQVWTAGRAGRDRFHRAKAGVADSALVEVGRPQLDTISEASGPGANDRPFTVLYAPTWEGWSNDMLVTSLQNMGTQLVRLLLELEQPVRVIYKPHPLTGIRDKNIAGINTDLRDALRDANRLRAELPGFAALDDPEDRDRAAADVAALSARIAELKRPENHTDALQRARDNGVPDSESTALSHRLQAELVEAYWKLEPAWHHRVVKGTYPHLYDCFTQADLLVSDVSSVVSDFIATGKPYVICNPSDIDTDQFRADNTAAGGAYVLGSDVEPLREIVAGVRGVQDDTMAEARKTNREYLLGPAEPAAQLRFGAAIDGLIADTTATAMPVPGVIGAGE
ncbi:MAG: hypothetical protein ACRD0P_11545, partial [Stackebrandtia sp.]